MSQSVWLGFAAQVGSAFHSGCRAGIFGPELRRRDVRCATCSVFFASRSCAVAALSAASSEDWLTVASVRRYCALARSTERICRVLVTGPSLFMAVAHQAGRRAVS